MRTCDRCHTRQPQSAVNVYRQPGEPEVVLCRDRRDCMRRMAQEAARLAVAEDRQRRAEREAARRDLDRFEEIAGYGGPW